MPSFFVVGQFRADTVDHHLDESAIIHIHPVHAADELVFAVSYERAVDVLTQVWFVEAGQSA